MRFGFRSRQSQEQERAEEIRAHLALLTDQLIARGLAPEDAEREARLQFGNPRVKLEETDELNRIPIIERVARDVTNAFRSLRAARGFTAVTVIVLTLASGAASAVFSVSDAVALQGLPFENSDRIVAFDMTVKGAIIERPFAPMDYLAMRSIDAFTGVAAVTREERLELRRHGTDPPSGLNSLRVSAEFFGVLNVRPAIGRAFTLDDETPGRQGVAVISDGVWRSRYGASNDIVGQLLPAADGDLQIIGVMPRGFSYPVDAANAAEVWTPYVPTEQEKTTRFRSYLRPIARLRDGASIADAHERIDALNLSVSPKLPPDVTVPGREGRLTLRPLRDSIVGDSRQWMVMLLAAAGCVLLVACVNIAHLVLVRTSARARELSVRAALGASHRDLARLLMAESLLLSLTGTALGVALAWAGLEAIRDVLPQSMPRIRNIDIDMRGVAAAGVMSLLTGLAFSLIPILNLSRSATAAVRANAAGDTASRRSLRVRSAFLITEVALATVLLVGTALFLASFARLTRVDVGLDYRNVLLMNITRGDGVELARIADAITEIPGVQSAAVGRGSVPFSFSYSTRPLSGPGIIAPNPNPGVDTNGVTADYFRTLGTALERGRAFTADDVRKNAPVIILDAGAAETYFPGQDPIGRTVDFGGTRTVIGVVAGVRGGGPQFGIRPGAYVPITGWDRTGGTLMVKTSRDPMAVADQVKGIVWSYFPDLAIPPAQSMAMRYGFIIERSRLNTIVMVLFGFLAVTIAGVGVYGVMSFVVYQRTREIGIRMALGARPSVVLRSVLRRATLQVAAGFALGIGIAWWLSTLVTSFLFRGEPHDLRLYALVGCALAIVALIAAYSPARRAARVDPLIALRVE